MKTYRKNTHSFNVHLARVLSILMILSMLTGGLVLTGTGLDSAYSYAESQTEGDFEYTISGGSATLTAYKGKDAVPVIPSSIGGCKVTAIGPGCFRGNAKITKIRVPKGVTEIGDYAFEACSAATELVLPSTLEIIGRSAFSGDALLEEVTIPANVRKIGDGAFLYCMKLSSVSGGESLEEMGQFVFAGCVEMTKADLSSTKLTVLPDRTFCNCGKLQTAEMPDSIKTIGKRAFSNCSRITSLEFGPNVETVGDYVFEKCDELQELAFEGREGLRLGAHLFESPFSECTLHLRLPDNTELNSETLTNASVSGIYISGKGRLKSASGQELQIMDGQLYAQGGTVLAKAFIERYDTDRGEWVAVVETVSGGNKPFTRYTVSSGVRRIGPDVFGSKAIGNVFIPANVEEIDKRAFFGANVRSVSVSEDNSRYLVKDGLLCEKAKTSAAGAADTLDNGEQVSGEAGGAGAVDEGAAATDNDDQAAGTADALDNGEQVSNEADGAAAADEGAAATDNDDQAAEASDALDNGEQVSNEAGGAGAVDEGAARTDEGAAGAVEDTDNAEGSSRGEAALRGSDAEKFRLIRFFPYKLDGNSLVRITVDGPGESILGPRQLFNMPDYVSSIGPYAFYSMGIDISIADNTSLETFEDNSFSNSGIRDPRAHDQVDFEWMGLIYVSGDVLNRLSVSDSAFTDNDKYYSTPFDGDDEQNIDPQGNTAGDSSDTSDRDFNDRFARIPYERRGEDGDEWNFPEGENNDTVTETDPKVTYTSASGNKSLYSEDTFGKYLVIPNSEFTSWTKKYLDFNKDEIEFTPDTMPYTMLYKGDEHYRSMVCVLNHDQYKTEYSIRSQGDDFAPMYLAMDHGLEAELKRGGVPDDIVLYSGITVERMANIAGLSDKTKTPTEAQLISAIGREFTDPAFMSTTTNPETAAAFSSFSNTMVVIYASAESLRQLGTVCIESFAGWGAGEYELLLNLGARFKVLDVGTLKVSNESSESSYDRSYIRLELVAPDSTPEDDPAPDKPADETKPAPAAPAAPSIYTTAKTGKKMLVEWDKVSNAASYKLQYRKAGASNWNTVSVSGTSKTLTKMKSSGLYQFRVASVGSGNQIGNYSEPAYRYYKQAARVKYKAKKASVRVRWKKIKGSSGYQILVSENKNLKNAKIFTVKGGKKKSGIVKGLKSGKKYYFAVRPYKNKGGISYIGIRSKIRKVKVR